MTEHDGRKAPRWILIALVASLMVNVAILGAIGGAILREPERRAPALDAPGLRGLVGALTEEDRATMRTDLQTQDRLVDRRDMVRDALALQRAIAAEPFDRAAAEEIFTRQKGVIDAGVTRAQTALLDRIATMTAEERRAFLERVRENRRERAPRQRVP